MNRGFFVVLTCLFLLFFPSAKDEALAACSPAVKIAGSAYNPTSIQDAYDYASHTLGLSDFTLLLAGEIFTENLVLDGGTAVLDGGYDCSFTTKTSTSGILGTVTISTGSLKYAASTGGVGVVSTTQCDFDTDLDGYTRIGSCAGSANDCNDNNPNVNPGAVEICDGLDNNCNGQVDEGLALIDADGDGYYGPGSCGAAIEDCNDNNATIHPGALDIPYDGIDQDCNGADLTFANGDACADCHVPDNALDSVHSYRSAATDTSCTVCHAGPVSSILSGHYGKIVRTTDNLVAAGSTINCWTCHDNSSHSGGFPLGDGKGDVWNDVAPPYPSNYTCDNCHANRAARHNTVTAHNNRVIDSSCANCHTSDTTVLGNPGTGSLTSDAHVDTLHGVQQVTDCAICHNYTGTKLNAGIVRQAIQQGLNGTPITCTGCHTDKTSAHGSVDHVAFGYVTVATSCSTCHDPGTTSNATVSGTHRNNCALCHTTIPNLQPGLPAGGGNCAACHSSTWEVTHTLNIPNHSSLVQVATTSCALCHDDTLVSAAANTHNGCSSCHNTDGSLRSLAVGQNFITGGNCATCHTAGFDSIHATSHTHTVGLGSGDLSNGTSCGSCHVVANWAEIEGVEHNVATNGAGSCATCHNSPRQEVIDAIALGADPTNCLNCHSNKTSAHSSVDHVAFGYVTLATSCQGCHDPGTASNATVTGTHLGNCTLCHTNVPNLQPGIPVGGGDCTTCHGANFQTLHTSCTTCHGVPPSGTTSPNREGAHTDHTVLGFGSATPSCVACHDGATHNGTTDVAILTSFNAMSGTANSNGSTCTSTSCHGGQTTPAWSTGSINVNTQCNSCHTRRTTGDSFPNQYNDYFSGEHNKHRNEAACTDCHSITKLATGHFSNLETSAFEQDPAATIGGSGTKVGSYDGARCSNIQCHGSENW